MGGNEASFFKRPEYRLLKVTNAEVQYKEGLEDRIKLQTDTPLRPHSYRKNKVGAGQKR